MNVVLRFLLITRILSAQLVFYKFNIHRDKSLGVRIRESCQRLGPTFMKIGQLLSTRYDIFSKEDCEEMQKLLDRIPPFRYDVLREIFLHDFGSYPEQIFKTFNKTPIASASIAQTHAAYLKTGEKVAVKVRRPYIGKKIESDLRLVRILASIGEIIVPKLKYLRGKEVLDEMKDMILNEIDFRHEAQNIMKARKYLEDIAKNKKMKRRLGKVLVPDVHQEFCSYNVLTMEFMEGTPINKYNEEKRKEYDPLLSVNSLLSFVMRNMVLERAHYFHGDPHPANLLMQPNGDIVLLDFGVLGKFDERFSKLFVDFVVYIYLKDVDGAVNTIADMAQTDRKIVRERIEDDMREFLERASKEGLEYWFSGLLKTFLNNKIYVAREFGLFARTMVLLHGITTMIDKEITTMDLLGPDIADIIKYRMKENMKADFVPVIYNLTEKFKRSPEMLNRIINRYYDDPLKLISDIKREMDKVDLEEF